MLQAFPDVAGEFIYPGEGREVENMGDGVLVKTCRRIVNYQVSWNQRRNTSCYHFFPVNTTVLGWGFLELSTRRISPKSHKIKCGERNDLIYVKDKGGKFWEYKLEQGFRRIKAQSLHTTRRDIALPQLAAFNSKLFHLKKQRPHRLTLLHLVAQQQNNLHTLYEYETEGGGSLTDGILKAITTTIRGIGSTGSQLIKSIANGLSTGVQGLGNATSNVIGTSAEGINRVLDAVGGISNLVLYWLDLIIIGYLVFQRWEQRRVPRELSGPPVPPRGRLTNH